MSSPLPRSPNPGLMCGPGSGGLEPTDQEGAMLETEDDENTSV